MGYVIALIALAVIVAVIANRKRSNRTGDGVTVPRPELPKDEA